MNHNVAAEGNFSEGYVPTCTCGWTGERSFRYYEAERASESHREEHLNEVLVLDEAKSLVLADYHFEPESGLIVASRPSPRQKLNEETQAWVPEGTVVGRIIERHIPCKMAVGRGAKSHYGYYTTYEIEAEGLSIKLDRYVKDLQPGRYSTEPMNTCGANAFHKMGGYAGLTRNGNHLLDDSEEVTCTKCIKQHKA